MKATWWLALATYSGFSINYEKKEKASRSHCEFEESHLFSKLLDVLTPCLIHWCLFFISLPTFDCAIFKSQRLSAEVAGPS